MLPNFKKPEGSSPTEPPKLPIEQRVKFLEDELAGVQQEIRKLNRTLDEIISVKFEPEVKIDDIRALIAELRALRS